MSFLSILYQIVGLTKQIPQCPVPQSGFNVMGAVHTDKHTLTCPNGICQEQMLLFAGSLISWSFQVVCVVCPKEGVSFARCRSKRARQRVRLSHRESPLEIETVMYYVYIQLWANDMKKLKNKRAIPSGNRHNPFCLKKISSGKWYGIDSVKRSAGIGLLPNLSWYGKY